MNKIVNSLGRKIGISIDEKIKIDNEKLEFWLKRFCPCLKNVPSGKVDYQIYLTLDQNEVVSANDFESHIQGMWSNGCESFLAKYVAQVFQQLMLKDDILIVPAACITLNDSAILIMGDYWQGKTSVAMYVKEHIEGIKIISDNYIAVKDDKVIGHSSFVSLRKDNSHTAIYGTSIVERNNRLFFESEEDSCSYQLS